MVRVAGLLVASWQLRSRRESAKAALDPSRLEHAKKDGREVLREIKADLDLRRIPVIVLTTSQADTDIGGVYELGANSFITKPVKFDALIKVMKALDQYWFGIVELPGPGRNGL